MADEKKVNAAPVFFRDGKLVNGKGQEVDKNGQVKEAPADSTGNTDAEVTRLQGELSELQSQVETHATAQQEWEAERTRLQGDLTAAQKAVTDGKLLPPREQAIATISAVKRVSDEMAAEIYDALTAPAGK